VSGQSPIDPPEPATEVGGRRKLDFAAVGPRSAMPKGNEAPKVQAGGTFACTYRVWRFSLATKLHDKGQVVTRLVVKGRTLEGSVLSPLSATETPRAQCFD
jgi:hypothetical protein